MSDIIRKNNWTEQELKASGFQKYARKKQVVMARRLPDHEAPKTIRLKTGDTLIATKGYMICYITDNVVTATLDDYEQWPVEPNIFAQTYREWDEMFLPTASEQKLVELGCAPYYKAAEVWAKPVDEDVFIQSLEHEQPVKVETGRVLAIGVKGEPYSMSNQTFSNRYQLAQQAPAESPLRRAVERLLGFFKR